MLKRLADDDKEGWKAYWEAQAQPWRTEPEIAKKRQEELATCRAIVPNIEEGIYPFKGVKLARADVEWLLATHESGRGPIDWSDEKQHKRKGLDLRGADLSHEDLSGLPLARLNSGLKAPGMSLTDEQRSIAAVNMEYTNFQGAQLQNANLEGALLKGASFHLANLQGTYLVKAQLQSADLSWTQLRQTNLREAYLQDTNFFEAELPKTYLFKAQLQSAQLSRAKMEDAVLDGAILSDEKYGPAYLADVDWGNANLAVVDWKPVKRLGEEQKIREQETSNYKNKERSMVDENSLASRAYRQLTMILRNQGLNEEADRFAYRGQLMQRKVLWYQRKFGQYFFSLFLDLLAGYGFKPVRWLYIYLGTIILFSILHYVVEMPHLTLFSAITVSIVDLHGRPFLNSPSGLVGIIDIGEAFVGLVVEAILIAIITQRILGK